MWFIRILLFSVMLLFCKSTNPSSSSDSFDVNRVRLSQLLKPKHFLQGRNLYLVMTSTIDRLQILESTIISIYSGQIVPDHVFVHFSEQIESNVTIPRVISGLIQLKELTFLHNQRFGAYNLLLPIFKLIDPSKSAILTWRDDKYAFKRSILNLLSYFSDVTITTTSPKVIVSETTRRMGTCRAFPGYFAPFDVDRWPHVKTLKKEMLALPVLTDGVLFYPSSLNVNMLFDPAFRKLTGDFVDIGFRVATIATESSVLPALLASDPVIMDREVNTYLAHCRLIDVDNKLVPSVLSDPKYSNKSIESFWQSIEYSTSQGTLLNIAHKLKAESTEILSYYPQYANNKQRNDMLRSQLVRTLVAAIAYSNRTPSTTTLQKIIDKHSSRERELCVNATVEVMIETGALQTIIEQSKKTLSIASEDFPNNSVYGRFVRDSKSFSNLIVSLLLDQAKGMTLEFAEALESKHLPKIFQVCGVFDCSIEDLNVYE